MGAESSPKIAIVDESPIRAAILEEGLREAGYTDVVRIGEMNSLLSRIYAIDPDVIVIDLENPSRDILEQMFQVSRAVRRPVAMFVDQSDAASICSGSAPMQPVTMTLPFSAMASPIAPSDSRLALSRKPQVLTMTRSAPSCLRASS